MGRAPTVAAQAFLRSPSGVSLRDWGTGPLPDDLAAHVPAPPVRDRAVAELSRLGFRAVPDALGFTVSLDAPADTFRRVFGVDEDRLAAATATATTTLRLPIPPGLRDVVDEIVVLPRPEPLGG